MRLALFDLDHTLLDGDSDQLWCDFLIDKGLLDKAIFSAKNEAMARDYKSGAVDVQAFCEFYIGTLTLKSPQEWEPLRQEFLQAWVIPRLCADGKAQIKAHQTKGDRVVMTTATNRFITELTATHLGIQNLIATEAEVKDGLFTGRTQGVLNMREGKVARLKTWCTEQGLAWEQLESWGYSDSINDLPLLAAVTHATVTQGDVKLRAEAAKRGWPQIEWF
ncbi:HAD family hydrolase [Limnohabitans sp. 103DPR2]|uniref:HAD family hydrolase n=1 Tax=Limnohabitans sp. 103DPR2 TaxID=1678129 RepID=UPI0006DC9621|nr:HAD family hydrolase [Limnohabitans sp. 103DPR2]ALK91620.1 haloacid dehalogenase-like hydrolase [Limnohabitans sp. 103DPR2]